MVKRAFTFAFYGEFLTHLSTPLGAPDTFSGACRPSRTTKSNAVPLRVSSRFSKGWCYIVAPQFLAKLLRRSHLRSTLENIPQHQIVVNLRGVFSSRWNSAAYSPRSEFIRPLLGTVGISLLRWCKTAFNRQGITLP